METIKGSDRNEVIRQIEEALGSEGSRMGAEYIYSYLGGNYRSDARACVVEFSPEQWVEAVNSIPAQVQCECGQATGEACDGVAGADAVTVEWMPEYLRASHEAAGNSGRYPANGALRLRVTPACAEMLTDNGGEVVES